MQKLGMKPVPGISRVTIKKSKNVGGLGCTQQAALLCHRSIFCLMWGCGTSKPAEPLEAPFVDMVLLLTTRS